MVALPGLSLFYLVFSPLTIYPAYFLLGLLYKVTLLNSTIFLSELRINLIGPCVAGSAYYLLLILNLSTPNIKIKKRINMIALSFLSFLILNIIRIVILTMLATKSLFYFNLVHMLFWYILSIIFVVIIWFYMAKRFKIKDIPFYSDLKILYRYSKK